MSADVEAPCARAAAMLIAEAHKARRFGAHHVARIFEACARTLPLAPRLHERIETWPSDEASSALAYRLSGGLHSLIRRGHAPELRALGERGSALADVLEIAYDLAIAQALIGHEDELLHWLSRPTQTNEVARVAGVMAVLAELDAVSPLDTEVLELGASAGLNLNLSRYAFDLGGTHLGPQSRVTIAPEWCGRGVPQAPVSVIAARGVDLSPLDVSRQDDRERLFAYSWPGMERRTQRLGAAMALACAYQPHVDTGSAVPWLAEQLAVPQPRGVRRVVSHSMVMQYMPQADRDAVMQMMVAAGERATPDRPLVRVGLEWREDRRVVEVRCSVWDGSKSRGRSQLVATCHPYAEWFEWRGLARD